MDLEAESEVKKFEITGRDLVELMSEELVKIEKKTREASHLDPAVIRRGINTLHEVSNIINFRQKSFRSDCSSILEIIERIYCAPHKDVSSLDFSSTEFNSLVKDLAEEFEKHILYYLFTNINEPLIVRYIRYFIDFCLSQVLISDKEKELIRKVLDIVIEKNFTLVSDF